MTTLPAIPLLKRVSARVYYGLVNAISETPVHQGAADFRLLSRRVVEVFQRGLRERTLFLRGLVSWLGFASCAVRFRPGARRAGQTKYPLGRMVRFGLTGIVSLSPTGLFGKKLEWISPTPEPMKHEPSEQDIE